LGLPGAGIPPPYPVSARQRRPEALRHGLGPRARDDTGQPDEPAFIEVAPLLPRQARSMRGHPHNLSEHEVARAERDSTNEDWRWTTADCARRLRQLLDRFSPRLPARLRARWHRPREDPAMSASAHGAEVQSILRYLERRTED